MFTYWGRQGSLSQLTLELANLAVARRNRAHTFSVSAQNELFDEFSFLRDNLLPIDTFDTRRQSLQIGRIMCASGRLQNRFKRDCTRALVSLMPHVWSPCMKRVIRQAGVRHIVIVHDAKTHPGDWVGLVNGWLLREADAADHVITLSDFVASQLIARGLPRTKVSALFHPDLDYGCIAGCDQDASGPLRVLFFGRILPYKGLDLLVGAVECLRRSGVVVRLDVYGEGKIKPEVHARLLGLGSKIENRWLQHREFKSILPRYDVVAVSHIEASQSGVVAAAFGAGLPVVATPVGGLVEQVTTGVTGIIAESVSASALATALRTLVDDRSLLARFRRGIASRRAERSMERFYDKVCEIALC
jgi:glycosyltransferase involved in cell wall biosynthesis